MQSLTTQSTATPSLISIVVCTFDRAAMLANAVRSLMMLETNNAFRYEIVIVDNASTDGTAQTAAELQVQSPVPVRYVYEAKKGIAAARNRGVREATGEWIAFFDDDQLADSQWLAELHSFAQRENLPAVGGSVFLKLLSQGERNLDPFVRMLLGESRWSTEPFAYSPKISPGAGNLMLHRSVFDRVGLFNERFATRAEDTDLFCRMWQAEIETWYVPTAIVHHVTPAERLESGYLNRLAKGMGEGIAEREADARAIPQFALRWCAKTLLLPVLARVKLAAASILKRPEQALAWRCRQHLNTAFTKTGWQRIASDVRRRVSFARFSFPKSFTASSQPSR